MSDLCPEAELALYPEAASGDNHKATQSYPVVAFGPYLEAVAVEHNHEAAHSYPEVALEHNHEATHSCLEAAEDSYSNPEAVLNPYPVAVLVPYP